MTYQRGKSGDHNKITDEKIEKVKDHIKKIPTYKSHYVAHTNAHATTESFFILPEYTLKKLYELSKEDTDDPVSQSRYNEVFYTNFNIQRKPLKKNTCTFDSFKARLDSTNNEAKKANIQDKHEEHLILVEKVREQSDKDMKCSAEEDDKETLSFALQKTLPLPRIPTNIVY